MGQLRLLVVDDHQLMLEAIRSALAGEDEIAIDDHQLMLEAIRSALAGEDEIAIVGEARSGYEALVLARDVAQIGRAHV